MRWTFFLIFICGFFATAIALCADLTDAQKRALFLQSKSLSQQTSTSTATSPSPSPTPHKKVTHSSAASKKKTATTKHSHHAATTTHTPSSTAHHSSSSSEPVHVTSSSSTSSSVAEHAASFSHDKIIPISEVQHASTSPVITIEKSGVIADQGLEPTPTPEPTTKHGWGWIFGSNTKTYHYLTWSVRRAIDRAPVRRGRWKYIIVHNSGTRAGNARTFDIYHRRVRKMVNGLAYHFVIGNGVSSGNGEIEIGHRWTAQLQGGHVASDYLNDISLGICLVGDYNHDLPTKAQIGALDELITYLRQRVGRTEGRQAIVAAHKEINPRPTDCPGDRFPYQWLHGRFGKGL